jgi:predicted trehalose synthase
MEVALGDRFKSPIALSEVEQIQLLRAAIAYSLAGDDAGLARLRARYGAQVQATKTPDVLRVALAGGQDTAAMSQASGPDIFAAWVDAMKHRLLTAERAQA